MPTRIVLNDSDVSRRRNILGIVDGTTNNLTSDARRSPISSPSNGEQSDIEVGDNADADAGNNKKKNQRNVKFLTLSPKSPKPDKISTSKRQSSTGSNRKTIKLRSSLFHKSIVDEEERRALSKEDIRASSRLLGYLFQAMASIVMLISVLKFYFDGEKPNKSISDLVVNKRDRFWVTPLGPVELWKMVGCITISGLGTILTVFIIVMHFDTIAFPDVWRVIFQDGSRYEKYLCLSFLLFWMAGLHINTSTLSVGEVQPNVFFTTWIAFFSSVVNCGVWRVSAGHRSIAEFINDHPRETTFNWLWTFFFASICAGALSSTYANRKYIEFKYLGETVEFSRRDWIIILTVVWGVVVVCLIALILNHYLKKSCEVRMCKGKMVLIGWRQFEGLIAIGLAGTYFWLVFSYTGTDNFINGLNNVYFGLWGTFINSVFLTATWLRENKNIDIVKKEERKREGKRMKSQR